LEEYLLSNLEKSKVEKDGSRVPDPWHVIHIVDDDEPFRDSLMMLCESVGLPATGYASGLEFLQAHKTAPAGCLLLDVRMPGMSGLEVQERLSDLGWTLPIVFITGHGDIPMAVRALKLGAADFLTKPFSQQDLLDRIQAVMRRSDDKREQGLGRAELLQRLDSLTPREAQVMELVVCGLANKVIANRLDISQRTVEIHRSRVMEKMGASSLAELVRMSVELE
jgi:RNA polymerase sigma factor (sigma-70 family)